MAHDRLISFPPYTLDVSCGRLLRGAESIPLRPKTFALLQYFVENPERLVSKEELISAVWPKTRIVDAALKVSIGEIRKALGDSSTRPKFIETVGRKGYRFIAPVSLRLPDAGKESLVPFVGRMTELEELRHCLEVASSGKRQLVFVTGEPGIGKTALIEFFCQKIAQKSDVLIGRGQCIEQFGSGEAYMPVLDAVERLCCAPGGAEITDMLRRFAPSWLANLLTVIDAEERLERQRRAHGIAPERRLREIAVCLEAVARDKTVLLVLEDLHWLDPSTLALISYLARRPEAARLLVIGTYRGGELERIEHPLKSLAAELALHRFAVSLPLKALSREAVGEYLARRFVTPAIDPALLSTVYERSGGNPLYMVHVTDYLVQRDKVMSEGGSIKLGPSEERNGVPPTLRDLIERQFQALAKEEQDLLATASVAGMTFTVSAVASAMAWTREAAEVMCRAFAEREQFVQYAGARQSAQGEVSARYSFVHALYQNVIYDRVEPARRAQLHRLIGERMEAVNQAATSEVAAELALHFERAGDQERAVAYALQAAQNGLAMGAYAEAIAHANHCLSLLRQLPANPSRSEIEVSCQLVLGNAYGNTRGFAAAETAAAFSRARSLFPRVRNEQAFFQALVGLWVYHTVSADHRLAREIGRSLIKVAERVRDDAFIGTASMVAGLTSFYMGDIPAAYKHLKRADVVTDHDDGEAATAICGWNPRLAVLTYLAQALWFSGYSEQGGANVQRAIILAQKMAVPYDLALTYGLAATYYTYAGDFPNALTFSESTLRIAQKDGFHHWSALGTIIKGFAFCRLGRITDGLGLIPVGIRDWKEIGADKAKPVFYGLEGEAYLMAGKPERALISIEHGLALCAQTGEANYAAELWRLKGEGLLKAGNRLSFGAEGDAEDCFKRAIAIARRQRARALELRATLSLCRLWQRQGEMRRAKNALARIYGRFTDGFDSPDLKNAESLLKEFS